jgi:tetratricopeptide (TPR) repeat protein
MTILQQLNTLESTGLIRPIGAQSSLEYIFRHAMIHDTAYRSLIKNDRKELNLAVGEALEQLFPDRLEENAARLAWHFAESGDAARTLHYAAQAGDAAARLYANQEAEGLYVYAIEAARRMNASIEVLLHLYSARGRVLELAGNFEEALANYQRMLNAAQKLVSPQLELSALMALGTLQAHGTSVHNPAEAKRVNDQALSVARAIGDHQAEAKVLWNLMLQSAFTGQTNAAVDYGEQSLHIARTFNLREQLAFTLNDLAFHGYYSQGDFARGLLLMAEARALWQEFNNQPMLSDNFVGESILRYVRGEYDAALIAAAEAQRISERIGNLWGQSYCRWVVGEILFERGEIDRAIETSETCIALADQTGFVGAQVGIRSRLALMYGSLGLIDKGLEIAQRALKIAEQELMDWRHWPLTAIVRLSIWQGQVSSAAKLLAETANVSSQGHFELQLAVPFARVELALAQNNFELAVQAADTSLSVLEQLGARSPRIELLLFKSRALFELQAFDRADETLQLARTEAQSLGSRHGLWKIFDLQSKIKAQQGRTSEAAAQRTLAQAQLEFIVAHTPIELRGSFLDLPDVRRAMMP